MSANPTYWKMRNGKLINVDDMDQNRVRNSFKILLRNLEKLQNQRKASTFTLNGDMANEFNESHLSDEDDDRFDEFNDNAPQLT